jgi:diguanylate cyclase (GGDEF)-like protein
VQPDGRFGRWRIGLRAIKPLVAAPRIAHVQPIDDAETRVTKLAELNARRPGQDCLVVIHTPSQSHLGHRYLLAKQQMTIGRGKDNDIVLPSDCVSRRHSRVEQRGEEIFVLDLGSTNGTFVNDEPKPVKECRLNRGDQLRIGDTIFKYLSGSDVEAQYHEVVFLMRITDGLTNLHNRKQLDTLVEEEIARARRHDRELSVLMLDIDHFKKINDTHGHLAGDSVLRNLAAMMQKRLRPGDKLGRYGGEEFCAILPETSLENAAVIAEELRALVAGASFRAESQEINVTISIGAGALREGMLATDLYQSADKMLYQAKRTGRNKVCSRPVGG